MISRLEKMNLSDLKTDPSIVFEDDFFCIKVNKNTLPISFNEKSALKFLEEFKKNKKPTMVKFYELKTAQASTKSLLV